jgi:pSer/pThr/pTyr-binding forkhead associated (FHA) protein
MSSPRFPATATLLYARQCPLEKFDSLFEKITQEHRIADGYFLQTHPADARLLFVVNGLPFGAGRIVAQECSALDIHEFFEGYEQHPQSPLSFLVADKRLLLGLMVIFCHVPAVKYKTDLLDIQEILGSLAERKADLILGLRSEEECAVSICSKGCPAVNFLPSGAAGTLNDGTPEEQLVAYVRARPGKIVVDVYEATRAKPSDDAILATRGARGHLTEVFLRGAAKDRKEAPGPAVMDLETPLSVVEAQAGTSRSYGAPPMSGQKFPGPIPEVSLFLGEKQLGTFSLAGGELTIGRTPGNNIVIDNVGVSRRHAVIRVKAEKVFLEDLGSANGTLVRGQKITSRELSDGDEILIVKHRLVYRVPREGQGPPRSEAVEDIGQKTMYIEASTVAQAGGRPGSRVDATTPTLRPRLILPDLKKLALETDEVILGSGSTCHIHLSGMFIGKMHAKIVRAKEGQFKIQHLGGLAGTRVNGEKITERILKHGDEIEIGRQKLLFRLER